MSTKIECDQCKKDITRRDSIPGYRIMLAAERIAPVHDTPEGVVHVTPPMPFGIFHFCSINHLEAWLNELP